MLTWNLLEIIFSGPKWFRGAPSAVGAACGVVTGLVAITPAAGFVSNMWAFFFGFFGVIPTFFTPRVVRLLGVDDRLDCFAFHVRWGRAAGVVGRWARASPPPPLPPHLRQHPHATSRPPVPPSPSPHRASAASRARC